MAQHITVHGEHYDSLEDLGRTIAELIAQAGDMPDGAPERHDLERHIERLAERYDELAPPSGNDDPANVLLPKDNGDGAAAEDGAEQADEESPAVSDDTSAVLCPVCGQDWDIPEAPPTHPTMQTCTGCRGWGQVLTGSRVEGHIVADCPTCQGSGWTRTVEPMPVTTATRAENPLWPGARLSDDGSEWLPPAESTAPPWSGAVWDSFRGTWG